MVVCGGYGSREKVLELLLIFAYCLEAPDCSITSSLFLGFRHVMVGGTPYSHIFYAVRRVHTKPVSIETIRESECNDAHTA